jgi:hypothetical protein
MRKQKLSPIKFHKPLQEFFHKDQPKTNNSVKDDKGDLFPFAHYILN